MEPLSAFGISATPVDHRVGTTDEGLPRKADPWIVEHPHAEVFVGRDDVDCVNGFGPLLLTCSKRVAEASDSARLGLTTCQRQVRA